MKKFLIVLIVLIVALGSYIFQQDKYIDSSTHNDSEKVVTSSSQNEKKQIIDTSPFINAGCTLSTNPYEKDTLICKSATFASRFSCVAIGSVQNPFGVPMISCGTFDYHRSLTSEQYFDCGGGMLPTCTSYLIYADGQFSVLQNEEELIAKFGSIQTPEQAKWLVFATHRLESHKTGEYAKKAPDISPTAHNGTYSVVGYYEQRFGCFDRGTKYPVYRYEYSVTKNGIITEKKHTVAYEHEGTGICVD